MGLNSVLKVSCPFILLVFLGLSQLAPIYGLTDTKKQSIDEFVQNVMKCRGIPGLAISIVHNNQIAYTKGYGYSDLEKSVEVTPQTKFAIGSVTKSFTATLLADMIDKARNYEKLNWHTPLNEILGQNFKLNTSYLTELTTLVDILSHKTGVPGYHSVFTAGVFLNLTRKEHTRRLRFLEPEFAVRDGWIYNNHMYMLAGHVAEILADDTGSISWENLLKTHILHPIGMNSTRFVTLDETWEDVAKAYVLVDGHLTYVGMDMIKEVVAAGPAGSILSTADDMALWLLFHINHGKTKDREELINPRILNEMYLGQASQPSMEDDLKKPTYPIDSVQSSYNLGLGTSFYRAFKMLGHAGELHSFQSDFRFFQREQAGVFQILNGPDTYNARAAIRMIRMYISDMLLGLNPWLNKTTACTFPEPWAPGPPSVNPVLPVYNDRAPRPLVDYEGTYGHLAFGNVTFTLNATINKLYMRYGPFFEGHCSYDARQDVFLMSYEGIYQYRNDYFPAKFAPNKATGNIDIVYLKIDDSHPQAFIRDLKLTDVPVDIVQTQGPACTTPDPSGSATKFARKNSIALLTMTSLLQIIVISNGT
ncbi:unnamed protein product [Owenia fusiformis]|uniref:Beta-lactamase-related domain-containing protein n=1 Tax=Owenia fusiformis TaxID=6347 RepID=A0A8S4NCJ5_OWEFU|nr:unnamed protein product [Owenia fusiformis]